MKHKKSRHALAISADEADLIAYALQYLVAGYEASANTAAGVSAFVLRGRVLAHAAACRRVDPSVTQFDDERTVSPIRRKKALLPGPTT